MTVPHQHPTPTDLGHVALVVQRAQVVEQLQRAHQGLGGGRVHEVEMHLQWGEGGGQSAGWGAAEQSEAGQRQERASGVTA